MNVILSIYSKEAFREYQLPSVNNADYTLTLRSDFFHLQKNRSIYLEVMDHVWSFKPAKGYSIRKDGTVYEQRGLSDRDVLNYTSKGKRRLSSL